jgi:hypothetical protein
MVQYDYAFDVSEDTKVDAITLPWGANHPCSMVDNGYYHSRSMHAPVPCRLEKMLGPH